MSTAVAQRIQPKPVNHMAVSTTEPAADPVEPPPLDTTTPAEGDITPFRSGDLQLYGDWLVARMLQTFPNHSAQSARGRIAGWINSNQHHFMKCGQAVGCVRIVHDEMDARPIVQEVFLFTFDTKDEARNDAGKLYREFGRWGKTMRAKRADYGEHSDVVLGKLKDMVKGLVFECVTVDLS